GVVDYVSKPFQSEEVQARVDTHLRLRRLQQKSEKDNYVLQEMVQSQIKQLAGAQGETVFAIAKLAESRDDQTGRHLERVQTLCILMAVWFSELTKYKTTVDSSWIRKLYYASALH